MGTMRTAAMGAVAALAVGVAAQAVLPPGAYEAARREAAHHVQIEIERVSGPGWFTGYGECLVKGHVRRVFRGDLEVDQWVHVPVDCAKRRAAPPPGPQLWVNMGSLRDAEVLEVYLDGEDRLEVASWQVFLLETVTDTPHCPADAPGLC